MTVVGRARSEKIRGDVMCQLWIMHCCAPQGLGFVWALEAVAGLELFVRLEAFALRSLIFSEHT